MSSSPKKRGVPADSPVIDSAQNAAINLLNGKVDSVVESVNRIADVVAGLVTRVQANERWLAARDGDKQPAAECAPHLSNVVGRDRSSDCCTKAPEKARGTVIESADYLSSVSSELEKVVSGLVLSLSPLLPAGWDCSEAVYAEKMDGTCDVARHLDAKSSIVSRQIAILQSMMSALRLV